MSLEGSRAKSMTGINKRILLEDFYKKKNNVDAESKDNIDSAKFDANEKYETLLKTSSLKELIQIDQKMKNEIKEMDSDMKTLVYENYNKFISASETIHQMKTNVESMEAEMQGLSLSMENISAKSDAINASLESHRSKLEHLSTVNRLLQKLQIVVSLPSRLRSCLKQKEYVLAVGYYCKTHKILEKYSDLPSFQSIKAECKEIMENVRSILWETLKTQHSVIPSGSSGNDLTLPRDYPHSAVTESAEMLKKLGDDVNEIKEELIKSHQAYISSLRNYFALTKYPNVPLEKIIKMHSDVFYNNMSSFKDGYLSLFPEDDEESAKIFKPMLIEFEKYIFEEIRKSISEGLNAESILDILQNATKTANEFNSVFPYADLFERANDFVSSILSHAISELFLHCEQEVKEKIYHSTIMKGRTVATEITTDMVNSLIAKITPLSRGCEEFLEDHFSELTTAIQLKAWAYANFIDSILHGYCDLGDHQVDDAKDVPINPQYCLFLYDISQSLETLIPSMIASFAENFRSQDAKNGKDDYLNLLKILLPSC